MCSPSTALKVNCLVIRHLYFRSLRGDLQEGHGCASRCQFLLFLCRSPFFPSTKSRFLCAFCLRNPRFRAFRAQNRGFCALLPSETPVFGRFEHKIEVFVRFCLPTPPVIWPFLAQNRDFYALLDKHDSGLRSERQRHCRTREWHIIRLVFILSRIGKEGKIAFAGVIGEGLF